MKRILVCLMVFCLLCACSKIGPGSKAKEDKSIKGVWITYLELDNMLNSADFKAEFKRAAAGLNNKKITDVFIHTKAFGETVYPSEYFPQKENTKKDFDVFKFIIDICRQNGFRVHAWINPYRIKTADSDLSTLPAFGTVYGWLSDTNPDNDKNITALSGVYLNPASSEVNRLIIDGIRELLGKYDVDGVHFDDYFYPTSETGFDAAFYDTYKGSNQNPLSLEDFRRANINSLISGVYTAIKFKDKNIEFSISPAADIDKNYNTYFADVSAWIENGCVDRIIPQLYFGFDYPDQKFRFDRLLSEWEALNKDKKVKMSIGLSPYKIGTDSEPDKAEWQNGEEVIEKQIEMIENDTELSGYVLFSYSHI